MSEYATWVVRVAGAVAATILTTLSGDTRTAMVASPGVVSLLPGLDLRDGGVNVNRRQKLFVL